MGDRDSLAKRLQRFITFLGLLSAILLIATVTQRLSEDALALLVGLIMGATLMIPLLALVFFVWRRDASNMRMERNTSSNPGNMPVVVVAPPALPNGYGLLPQWPQQNHQPVINADFWSSTPADRKFTIVGEED